MNAAATPALIAALRHIADLADAAEKPHWAAKIRAAVQEIAAIHTAAAMAIDNGTSLDWIETLEDIARRTATCHCQAAAIEETTA